jgi:hypothetical protein
VLPLPSSGSIHIDRHLVNDRAIRAVSGPVRITLTQVPTRQQPSDMALYSTRIAVSVYRHLPNGENRNAVALGVVGICNQDQLARGIPKVAGECEI